MTKSPTIVVTSTRDLSAAVDKILASLSEAGSKPPSKSSLLNILAAQIAGPKHNWGFLKGAEAPVIQKGLPKDALAALLPAPHHAPASAVEVETLRDTVPVAEIKPVLTGQDKIVIDFYDQQSLEHVHIKMNDRAVLALYKLMRLHGIDGLPAWGDAQITFETREGELVAYHQRIGFGWHTMNIIERDQLAQALHMAVPGAARRFLDGQSVGADFETGFQLLGESETSLATAMLTDEIDQSDIDRMVPIAAAIAVMELPQADLRVLAKGSDQDRINRVIDEDWPLLSDLLGID